jgi:ApaG protein
MFTATTSDIEIQVATHFAADHSVPFTEEFLFAYHVRITNHGSTAIQVMSREWYIYDGVTQKRVVRGEGLVGKQPHIPPGHTHEYVSYCNLKHPFGKMYGRFFAVRKADGQTLALEVPAFTLLAPHLLN